MPDSVHYLVVTNQALPCSDVGWGRKASQIIDALITAWDVPLSRGGKVLALTIPETKGMFRELSANRNAVNEAIRSYEEENLYVAYFFCPPLECTS